MYYSDVAVSDEVRHRLRQPTFDGCQWEDEEVLLLLQQMYIDLDLTSKFCIEMPVLRRFLYEVYNNYNEVPFHNFRHSFCVAQMVSFFIFTKIIVYQNKYWHIVGIIQFIHIFLMFAVTGV